MPPSRRALVCVLSLIPCVAAAAQRKGQVELTPFAGLYVPTANILEETDPGSGARVVLEQKSSFSFGARGAMWLSDRLALEVAAGYTPSEVKVTASLPGFPTQSASEGATVLAFSGRARYRFGTPAPARTPSFHLIGGLAVIARGGDVWDLFEQQGASVEGRTDIGAVLGGGLDLAVGTGLVLRFGVEDYIHQAKFTFDDGQNREDSQSELQNDFVVSVGLGILVGRR